MTATFVVNGLNVTVNFAYTETISKVIETVKASVKNIYPATGMFEFPDIPFEELTDQQILDFLDLYLLQVIINNAKNQLRQEMINDAMIAAQVEVDAELERKFL